MTTHQRPTVGWFAASEPARRAAGLSVRRELVLIAVVYGAYSMVRNLFGSAVVDPVVAADNADRIVAVEAVLGLDIEAKVQEWFVGSTAFIQFWNLFYGVAHFLVTFVVLGWMYMSDPAHYRFWRRSGLVATASALVGFAIFPLMPPRLLGDCGPYGACRPGTGFVDTVIEVGGIWSFEDSGMELISNQYAAMPSLHIGWALWCTLVLVPRLDARWARWLAIAYPVLTLFAIVVTANHWWIDSLGGALVLWFGCWVSRRWPGRSFLGVRERSSACELLSEADDQ